VRPCMPMAAPSSRRDHSKTVKRCPNVTDLRPTKRESPDESSIACRRTLRRSVPRTIKTDLLHDEAFKSRLRSSRARERSCVLSRAASDLAACHHGAGGPSALE